MCVEKVLTARGFEPIELIPTADQCERMKARFAQAKRDCLAATGFEYPRNSITKGEGRRAGFLLEEVLADYAQMSLNLDPPKSVDDPNCYWHYDLRSRWLLGNVEVKAKFTSCSPAAHFNGTVAKYWSNQKCDFYVFGRVLYDLSRVWICGCLPPQLFRAEATENFEGQTDPDSQPANPWPFKADCYNLHYDRMFPFPRLDQPLDSIDPMFLVQEHFHELEHELVCA